MDRSELKKYINLGKLPITVFRKQFRGSIDAIIRVTKGYCVFLDYDDDCDDEGGLRVTFHYDSFDEMVDSIEKYVNGDIELYKIYLDEPEEKSFNDNDWKMFQDDVYNHRLVLLENSSSFFIGDLYWRGLYLNEITPFCSDDEFKKWIKKANDYDDVGD
ncbi:MAG: hypothetical protein K2N72_08750 [Oscillospiraceae bacterium]|nr:hypothetical protein [Oscillospiraceae bacterium]